MSEPSPQQTTPRQRPWRGLVWLALLVVIVLGAAALAGPHLWAEYHFRAARQALDRHAFAAARRHLDRCLRVWPRSSETHFLAARAARLAGACDDAERHLKACEHLAGDSPELRLEEQLLQAQRGAASPDDEGVLWFWVRQGHADTGLILEALALDYLYTYRLREAHGSLERWLAWEPDHPRALYLRGLAREGLQDLKGAGSDYERAVELAPDYREARQRLAEFLLFSHKADEAAEHFEHLLEAEPDDPALLFGLARCRRQQGDNSAASEILDRLLAGTDSQQCAWLLERARVAQAQDEHAAAEEFFRRALALDPSDPDVRYALAACLLRRGQKEEARRHRERARQIERDVEQLRHLHEKIGKDPQNADLRYRAALICLRNGQKEEGRRWLLSVLRLNPAHTAARQALDGRLPDR
jgi:tetratricopeptide (TPR) repeat protein